MRELPKNYQAENYEDKIYSSWERAGYFKPAGRGAPFCIVLPPPNVTGRLHLGHSAMLSYQDIMIRYHRLKGDNVLWVPGMDHAAIATQNVVEKELKKENKTRHDLGREVFLKRVNAFAEESKKIIRSQLKKMGSSLEWSRERFTLDDNLTLAVRTAFKKMHDDGLIYRGDRVVNWCPRCNSTLADDEVDHREEKSKLYYIDYGPVTVATTRPETKLGDTAIAVNPKDSRYKKLVGKSFEASLAGHKIYLKVFSDRAVDARFGTGAIGVTPAHAHIDYQWALKYKLPLIKVINEAGQMTEAAGKYAGLSAHECREKLVADLEKSGQIKKAEEYRNNLPICYRCGAAIQPLPSKQWFVAVNKKIPGRNKTLKQLASEAVKSGKIKIIPARFYKTYFQWMDNLRDWCVSRQIWYGHRIPVWYRGSGKANGADEIFVGLKAPQSKGWHQDEDTLDTWFSSSLWTFSTLGWPKKTVDLKTFHPTAVMETGYDILFFWVARMVLMSTYLMKEIPFKIVYLHGLVRDKQGRKMSKSLGNGIDPLEMIKKFGADALRLSMVIGAMPGGDVRLYEEKIAGYRNFVNKLWNISRFILGQAGTKEVLNQAGLGVGAAQEPGKRGKVLKAGTGFTLADKWILSEFNHIIQSTAQDLEQFRFSSAGEQLYDFTWHKLADVYLEIAKAEGAKTPLLIGILEKLLVLWHPFCPFATEAVWQEFHQTSIMKQSWPKGFKVSFASQEKKKFKAILAKASRERKAVQQQQLAKLAKANNASKNRTAADNQSAGELKKYIEILKQKLANQEFLTKAPPAVVEKEKSKLAEAQERLRFNE